MFTHMNHADKISQTDTHVFFLNRPFSQWTPSVFTAEVLDEHLTFHCAEQYMMACKAILFQDFATLEKIMAVEQEKSWQAAPKRCKELGRDVTPFDPKVWDENAREIVFKGNVAKFDQNMVMRETLLATGSKYLVEGAHYDRIWGVGLAWDDIRIIDPANWQGTNWLGEILMDVRGLLGGEGRPS